MSNSIRRSSLVLLAVAIALALPACSKCGIGGPQAEVEEISGKVDYRPSDGDWQPAKKGTKLGAGHRLRTGAKSSAGVVFPDGSRLGLGPDSTLLLELKGEKLVAVLEKGSLDAGGSENSDLWIAGPGLKMLRVREGSITITRSQGKFSATARDNARITTSDGAGLNLSKGASIGIESGKEAMRFELLTGEVEVMADKSAKKGFTMVLGESTIEIGSAALGRLSKGEKGAEIRMLIGEAVLETPEGRKSLGAGTSYEVDIGGIELERSTAVPTFLLDRRRATRLRMPGGKRFRRNRRRKVPLQPAAELFVPRGVRATLVDMDNRLELLAMTKVRFGGVYEHKSRREGRLHLVQGTVRIRLRRNSGRPARQLMDLGGVTVSALTEGLTAEADVSKKKDTARITVHSGSATVEVNGQRQKVVAGYLMEIKNGKPEHPKPLPFPPITLKPGNTARIFFDTTVPSLAFFLGEGGGRFQLSSGRQFSSLLLDEPVDGKTFTYRLLRPGRFFWRAIKDGANTSLASFSLVRDPFIVAGRGRNPVNDVPDTGKEASIYFQGSPPTLRFLWKPVEGAKSYNFYLYREDRLERPLIKQSTSNPLLKLRPGTLPEGTYYWYQAAVDTTGKEFHKGRMNKLTITFDNAALLLRIDSPQPGQAPRSGVVRLKGVARKGLSITANGKKVLLDGDGRFDQALDGVRPRGWVVFRLRGGGLKVPTYFVRRLGP